MLLGTVSTAEADYTTRKNNRPPANQHHSDRRINRLFNTKGSFLLRSLQQVSHNLSVPKFLQFACSWFTLLPRQEECRRALSVWVTWLQRAVNR